MVTLLHREVEVLVMVTLLHREVEVSGDGHTTT